MQTLTSRINNVTRWGDILSGLFYVGALFITFLILLALALLIPGPLSLILMALALIAYLIMWPILLICLVLFVSKMAYLGRS